MSGAAELQREALRQQQLLRALWRRSDDGALALWARELPARTGQALAAYRGKSGAVAERALAAAFPTVRQLVGDESFDHLAQAYWQRHAPRRGDLAQFGAELPAFIAADAQLASEPYLADVARLEWAVHVVEQAADAPAKPVDLDRLGSDEPSRLRVVMRPGAALLPSRWPLVTIWQAHRSDAADRFAPVRAAFQSGQHESAWVWRDGWRARVDALPASQAAFVHALLQGQPLDQALARAGGDFSFEVWLRDALAHQWLWAVELIGGDQRPGDPS